jgi:hypothetical protein
MYFPPPSNALASMAPRGVAPATQLKECDDGKELIINHHIAIEKEPLNRPNDCGRPIVHAYA